MTSKKQPQIPGPLVYNIQGTFHVSRELLLVLQIDGGAWAPPKTPQQLWYDHRPLQEDTRAAGAGLETCPVVGPSPRAGRPHETEDIGLSRRLYAFFTQQLSLPCTPRIRLSLALVFLEAESLRSRSPKPDNAFSVVNRPRHCSPVIDKNRLVKILAHQLLKLHRRR